MMTTKRLTAQGLRELVKEEFSRIRGRRALREGAGGWSHDLAEAIESVAELIVSELVQQGAASDDDADEIRSNAVAEVGRVVGDIIDTWNETH